MIALIGVLMVLCYLQAQNNAVVIRVNDGQITTFYNVVFSATGMIGLILLVAGGVQAAIG